VVFPHKTQDSLKTFLLILLIPLLFVNPTAGQDSANVALGELYTNLVEAFKSENDSILQDFCYKLMAEDITVEFMRENHLCYRGIPCKLDEKGMGLNALGEDVFPNLVRVRNRMMSDGLMNHLTHLDSSKYKWDVVIIINKTRPGSSIPISQNNFSLSQEKYDQAVFMADSSGQTLEELFLDGKEGNVHVILGTEMPMHLKSNQQLITYSIGEMVFIHNKWCLFTKPNVDYSVRED